VYATNFLGTATNANNLNLNGSFVTANTAAVANTIAARDANNTIFATTFNGTATAADYADLAEKYLADKEYEVGTVVSVGGKQEVTACRSGDRALGAVSENPAFMMNQTLKGGLYIALKGRVPVKIKGTVAKGDRIIADADGCAIAISHSHQDVFGIALETSEDEGVKLVECVIL
jgi:hypothetical protein